MIINTYYSFSVLIYSVKMDFFKAFVLLEATKIIIRKNSKIKKKYFLFCWFCSKLKKNGGFCSYSKIQISFRCPISEFYKTCFSKSYVLGLYFYDISFYYFIRRARSDGTLKIPQN